MGGERVPARHRKSTCGLVNIRLSKENYVAGVTVSSLVSEGGGCEGVVTVEV